MAPELILHIGTSKTGSTSIQRVLSRNRKALAEQGVAYPKSPGFERHPFLAWAAMAERKRVDKADRGVWKGADPKARLDKFKQEFDDEMTTLPSDTQRVILSSEELSMRLLDHQSVQNLHDFLAPYFSTMSVLVWIRRPDQHYASLYSQMLRWGDAQAPRLGDVRVPPAHGYDFNELLDRWAAGFGDAAIRPQLFERVPGKRLDVVKDFLALCNIKLEIKAEAKAATANESFSQPAQHVLVEIASRMRGGRKRNVTSRSWRYLVDAATHTEPGKSWQPTQTEAADFVARFAENHEQVRKRWFPDRPTLWHGDYSDLPTEERTVSPQDALNACLDMLLTLGQEVATLEERLEDRGGADRS